MTDEFVTEKMCALRHAQADEKFDRLIASVDKIADKMDLMGKAGATDQAWATVGKVLLVVVSLAGTILAIVKVLA